MSARPAITIGTIVPAYVPHPAEYIRQILPHGFESIALFFWQSLGAVDLARLAAEIGAVLEGTGVTISALGIYGNPLGDGEADAASRHAWEQLIDHAQLFGTDLVTGFTGRVRGQPIEHSLPQLSAVFTPLAERAGERGVRLGFENCPMDGTWQTGDWNIAHGPEAWELIFDTLRYNHVGLEWEPGHPMLALADPLEQLRPWTHKLFHVHGKDAHIRRDIIRQSGVFGREPFGHYRLPGFGDADWVAIVGALQIGGYQGAIAIEGFHDPVFRNELEMTGQVAALNYLQRCRGGTYIANPA